MALLINRDREEFGRPSATAISVAPFAELTSRPISPWAPAGGVKAVRARAEDYLRQAPVRTRPDLIVVDPPRTGLGERMIGSLVKLGASRMRYVSCDPATLARDLAPLLAAGYHVEQAHLFDLFPETFHIESVLMLAR